MVAISKESVARSKDNKGRRMQLVMLSTCCLLTVVVAVKLLFHLENKTMKFRIRYDGKTYVAKVKVGNVTKAYYELYDGLPDRDEIFASLFGESAAIAEATEEVKESSSNVEPRTSATNPIEGGTVKIEMPKGRALDNYDALEPFAPVCTTEQLSKLAIQLPEQPCLSKPPWTRACSFTNKTICNQPTWLQQFHIHTQQSSTSKFKAVFIGCDKGKEAVNALRMGSRDEKYNLRTWYKQLDPTNVDKMMNGGLCPYPGDVDVSGAKPRQADVLCMEPSLTDKLAEAAQVLGWNENLAFVSLSSTVSLDKSDVLPASSEPIHFLYINSFGYGFTILKGSMETLKRVQYLEFDYTWKGAWENQNLEDAIGMLQNHGFVCYWPGDDKIWRISGCWQDFYSQRSWSRVACVNTKLPESVELVKLMEQRFVETLASR